MKYYAVTEDPRELYHYGVKGMKWGQHIFGDKPKSPGYHKALAKLRSTVKATTKTTVKVAKAAKSAIQKSAAQMAYNRREKQDRKYEKAVQEAQQKVNAIADLNAYDNDRAFQKQLAKSQKISQKMNNLEAKKFGIGQRNSLKNFRKEVNAEKKIDKYTQQAREGTLRYGKLSEDQIQRVQDRLALEANTRRLGGTEKSSWRKQKKEARRAGYLQGITKGTAAAMEEIGRAGAQYGIQHILDRRKLNAKAKQEGKQNRLRNREQNKKSHREINNEVKQEAYETRVREGQGIIARNSPFAQTTKQQAKYLKETEQKNLEVQRQNRIKDKFATEQDENFERQYISEQGLKNDKAAYRMHMARLTNDENAAAAKYGIGSQQHKEAQATRRKFDSIRTSDEEKKRLMLKYDKDNGNDPSGKNYTKSAFIALQNASKAAGWKGNILDSKNPAIGALPYEDFIRLKKAGIITGPKK